MFSYATVEPFFPTPVWIQDLEPEMASRLNRELMQTIDDITSPRPAIGSGASMFPSFSQTKSPPQWEDLPVRQE